MKLRKKIDRYLDFTSQEKIDYAITAIVFASVFFFFLWRVTPLTYFLAFQLYLSLLVASFIVVGLFVFLSKSIAIYYDYTATYERWTTGLLIGFFITFLSYGFVPVSFAGSIDMKRIPSLGHGKIFSGENKSELFNTKLLVLATLTFFGIAMQIIHSIIGMSFFAYLTQITGLVVFLSILPLGKTFGIILFHTKKQSYFLYGSILLAISALLIVNNMYAVYIGLPVGLVLGFIVQRLFAKMTR